MGYLLENDFLEIEISPQGAELMSVVDKCDRYQYLWQGDPHIWDRRAPILFPIIGRLNQGKYRYQDREYTLGLHGFASKLDFHLSEIDQNLITFSLTYNSTTLIQYPFEFRLAVTYILQERTLTTEFRVENAGHQIMWFSIGGHPGFNCHLNPDGRKDSRLVFEKPETVNRLVNESGFLTGNTAPFLQNQNTVDIASLDFDGKTKVYPLQGLRSETVTIEKLNDDKTVKVRFGGFPYLGIWSPSNRAPFLCIEPWHGITSVLGAEEDLSQKLGILSLDAGECFSCGYDVTYD